MNRENFIDASKGIGILLVVLGHVHNVPPYLQKWIYSFHMPLFFFISGYLFNSAMYKQYKTSEFIKNKLRSLIIPYFLMALICYFLFILFPVISSILRGDTQPKLPILTKYLLGILYSRGSIDWLPNCSPLWFLTCLLCAHIIFFVVNKKIRAHVKLTICLLLIGFAGYLTSQYLPFKLPWNIDTALTAVVIMGIGYFYRAYGLFKLTNKHQILFIFIFLAINLLSCYYNTGFVGNRLVDMASNRYGNILLFYLGGISGTLAIIHISATILTTNFLIFLGKNTMPIIGFNYAVIRLVDTTLANFFPYVWYVSFIIQVISLSIMILVVNNFSVLTYLCYGKSSGNIKLQY